MATRPNVTRADAGPPVAVILYGPPASGKDTVTAALQQLDRRFEPLQKRKVGSGRTAGYQQTSQRHLDRLRARGQVIYENERYGNTYVVDRPSLDAIMHRGRIPVVHMGQVEGVRTLITHTSLSWLPVLLWCPRATATQRLRARDNRDLTARLEVWNETVADVQRHGEGLFAMGIRTDEVTPDTVAWRIRARLHTWRQDNYAHDQQA